MSETPNDDTTPADLKAWENRMRRRLAVQGLVLHKSRTRLPMAVDYGLYGVADLNNNWMSNGYTLTARDVERWAEGS